MEREDVVVGKRYQWDGTDGTDTLTLSDPGIATVKSVDPAYDPVLSIAIYDEDDEPTDLPWYVHPAALSESETP